MEIMVILSGLYQDKNKPNLEWKGSFCLCPKRLPRPFGPRNDVRFSAPLCLSVFVAI
jgi:hypothetical protein